LATAALLAACGGGGGDSGGPPPVVTTSTTSSARYSDSMLITLVGSNLDQTLTFTGPGCRNYVRSTTAPNVSTATVAYYNCTVSGVGSQSISVAGGGLTVATLPFTVAVPQVTLLISNGANVAGSLVLTLAPDRTPLTVDNFLAYVKSGFYNGTAFQRRGRAGTSINVTGEFVLQGGGYDAPVSSATRFPTPKATNAAIALETGLSNLRYTVAMARTSAPNSATSEFFINTVDNTFLDSTATVPGYAAFATITTGTTLVDAMVAAPCNFSSINYGLNSPDCVPEPNLVVVSAQQSR
jgi:cyclophilin family peptidyl-prolyl cis-trans isomerase